MSIGITGSFVMGLFFVVFMSGVGLLATSLWGVKTSDKKSGFTLKFYSGSILIFLAFVAILLTTEWMFH
ncbi:hypothetical protein [Alicyclobacillus sp. SO9]|uniref:hypothetical protein n=1 Tax=Alicyclobacillus sp. SO9 TaxID=2665646 RepID=UPI0018E7A105|nr:hypothetical protein [Alicyclobacillus sp. SO9]QQE77852.1 hypothetical protein GI364_18320 [Alicyclobacillus sp. SO9]